MLNVKRHWDVAQPRHWVWLHLQSTLLSIWKFASLAAPGLGLNRAIDGALIALLLTVSFLLGCCQLHDADVWWHLRSGRWILEHGIVPRLDPFTFGSADCVWIDLSWTFQMILALLYERGGVAALILFTATVGTLPLALIVAARRKSWPLALTVLCLVPALVLMSGRFRPRPEIVSMLCLAAFLVTLWGADQRPRLLWLLPLLQVLWVNTHGLFVLGPIVLGFYLLEKGVARIWRRSSLFRPDCKRLATVAALVLLACLVNPYFVEGALFPTLLLPKVTASDNIYKEYISEFHSPRDFALRLGIGLCYRACFLLLLVLPISFILPAAWDAWFIRLESCPNDNSKRTVPNRGAGDWLLGLELAFGISVVAMGLLAVDIEKRWIKLAAPISFILLASIGGWLLWSRSRIAALIIWLGGLFEAAWVNFLFAYFRDSRPLACFESGRMSSASPLIALLAGTALSAEVGLRRGNLFRVLLVVAFAYLGLNAVRNISLLGLVGGAVLAWNLGEWVCLLGGRTGLVFSAPTTWALRFGSAGLLGAWLLALANNRYFEWAGEFNCRLGLDEFPGEFAHDAARFAGRPGLPDRAFVSSIAQAGVYVFHNGPDRKPLIDPRLELPSRETFARYVTIERWLQQQDPRWVEALHELGDPLVMLDHGDDGNLRADAALLSHPNWRCVYFDALAAIFVPRRTGALEKANPDVDFAGRLFRPETCPCVPDIPWARMIEARTLFRMARALDSSAKDTRSWRLKLLLGSLGRLRQELKVNSSSASALALLGNCYRILLAPPEPPQLTEAWEPVWVLPWAKATYCYQRARTLDPYNAGFLGLLYGAYSARKMTDAQLTIGEQLLALNQGTRELHEELEHLRRQLEQLKQKSSARDKTPKETVMAGLGGQQPERVVRAAEDAQGLYGVTWPWPITDHLAITYLHLGRPASARRIWEQVLPPSPAIRLCRIASTFWVEGDFDRAIRHYRLALAEDPKQAEAYWALAVIYAEMGQAGPALEMVNKGLRMQLSQPQRANMQELRELLPRYGIVPTPRSSGKPLLTH